MRPAIYRLDDIPRERRLHEGRMNRFSLRTSGAQIVFGEITPPTHQRNHRTPHDHTYDTLLAVISGTMMQDVEGIDYAIGPGAATVVPAYYMHRGYAYGDQPAVLFELFAPARHDYIDLVEWQREFDDPGEHWVIGDTFTYTPFTANEPDKPRVPIYQLDEIPREVDGNVRRWSMRTQHAQVIWSEITPREDYQGAPLTVAHDRLVIVQLGAMRMEVAGAEYDLPAGTAMLVPPAAPHRGHAIGDATASLLEIDAPARPDLAHLVAWQKEVFDADA